MFNIQYLCLKNKTNLIFRFYISVKTLKMSLKSKEYKNKNNTNYVCHISKYPNQSDYTKCMKHTIDFA